MNVFDRNLLHQLKKIKNMKQKFRKIVLVFMVLLVSFSCKKEKGIYEENTMNEEIEQETTIDKVSMAASQEIEGKKFVRNADIDMEVGDVYKSTTLIENKLKEVGGFVEASDFKSVILSENTFAVSEEKSMLVRKYYSENRMKKSAYRENGRFSTICKR